MARTVVLTADLLFGSHVQAGLQVAGHEVELVGERERLQDRLGGCEVLVVDLTDEALEGIAAAMEIVAAGAQPGREVRPQTLGFYSHVDVQTRERAISAGFDLVVPRSRMAREGGELVSRLVAGG